MRTAILSTLVLLSCLAGVARAGDLTVDDLIELKKVGFSDADIWKEVEKAGAKPSVGDAEAKRLRAAGFGDDFIARFRGSASMTLPDVEAMHKAGKDAAAILRKLGQTSARPVLAPADALRLRRAGVPASVLRGLKPEPLQLDEILLLAREGAGGAALEALVDLVGASFAPDAGQALDLVRAGVPADLVKRLKEGVAAPDASGMYEHPNGRFALRVPPGWRRLVHIQPTDFVVEYVFTPDPVDDPKKARHAFSIMPTAIDADSQFAVRPIDDVLRLLLPAIRAEEPGLDLASGAAVEKGKLAGEEAAVVRLEGRLKDRGDEVYRVHLAAVRKDGFLFVAGGVAPRAEYDRYLDAFGRCADSLRLGPVSAAPAGNENLTAQEWSERHKESVVLVQALMDRGYSSGTGFIVREDGYVLTNHHVIWDTENNRPLQEFRIHWDASLKRPPARATLIGWKRSDLGKRGILDRIAEWGADTALLKIEAPGPFKPMPIVPMTTAKLSDPILTLGFPLTGSAFDMRTLSLFATRGTVVRFNRNVSGRVDSIFTDAKFTHGNSGGPCVDLALGAVIGQNTFGYNIETEGPGELRSLLNDLVGYRGVIPIEHALGEFPDFMRMRAGFDRGWTAQDHFLLALDFVGQGSLAAATRQLDKALELDPRYADAQVLRASCALRGGDLDAFFQRAQAALALDPKHYMALVLCAQVHGAQGDLAKAAQFADRAVEARPDSVFPYMTRGALLLRVGRHEDALRDADKAAGIARGLDPAPDVLAGEVLYAMDKLDEGRDRMRKALEASPDDFDALMGHASYYVRKQMWEAAIIEYGKVQARLPLAPEADEALGRCYLESKDYDRAWQAYQGAVQKCRDVGRTVSEETYEGLAHLALDLKGDLGMSLQILVDYANAWLNSANAHVRLAELHAKAGKYPGLAFAHALLARMASQGDQAVAERVARIPQAAVSLDEILVMENMGYLMPALAVAQVAPLGFQLDRDKLRQLEGRMSPLLQAVFQIVLKRQEQGTTGGPGGGAPPPAEDTGRPPPQGPGGPAPAGPDVPAPAPAGEGWQDPAGAMFVPVPADFTNQPQLAERARAQGQGWVAFVAQAQRQGLFLTGHAFDPAVRDAAQALEAIRKAEAAAGGQMQVAGQQEVSFGTLKGMMAGGQLQLRNGKVLAWEVVLVPTRAGVRGIQFVVPQEGYQASQELRQRVYQGLRISDPAGGTAPGGGGDVPAPPSGGRPPGSGMPQPEGRDVGPPVPGGGEPPGGEDAGPEAPVPSPEDEPGMPPAGPEGVRTKTWKLPGGAISLKYPASFEPNTQVLQAYHANGIGWVSLLAIDRRLGVDFMVCSFDPPVGDANTAFGMIQQLEAANGLQMTAATHQRVKIGTFAGVEASGTIQMADGSFLVWEGRFVETGKGVRALLVAGSQGGFAAAAEQRKLLFSSFKVVK